MSPQYSGNREPLHVMDIIPMLNAALPQISVMFLLQRILHQPGYSCHREWRDDTAPFLNCHRGAVFVSFHSTHFCNNKNLHAWARHTLGSVSQALSSPRVSFLCICWTPITTFTRSVYPSIRQSIAKAISSHIFHSYHSSPPPSCMMPPSDLLLQQPSVPSWVTCSGCSCEC